MAYKRITLGPLNKVIRYNDATQMLMGIYDDAGAAIGALTGTIPQVQASGEIALTALASTGLVVGPASATDNALARWDLATGKLLQDSTMTLTDTGGLKAATGYVALGPTSEVTSVLTDLTTLGDHLVLFRDSADLLGGGATAGYLYSGSNVGMAITPTPLGLLGSTVMVGVTGQVQGVLQLSTGPTNEMGVLKMGTYKSGPTYTHAYVWATEDLTQLRLHTAAPTADTDGAPVGWVRSMGQFAKDDATPDISTSETWKAYGSICNLTDFLNPDGVQQITILGAYLNEQQTITIAGALAGDTFNIQFGVGGVGVGLTTDITWDAGSAAVQAALEAITNIGAGNVVVTEALIAGGGVYTIIFQGDFAETNVAAVVPTVVIGAGVMTATQATTVVGGSDNTSELVHGAATLQLGGENLSLNGDTVTTLLWDAGRAVWRRTAVATPVSVGHIGLFADGDTTPSIAYNHIWRVYGATNHITDFDDPIGGQELTVLGAANDELAVITITTYMAGGTFTITHGGNTTGNLSAVAATETAANVQAELEALASIGAGNVEVTGADGGPFTVHFKGDLAGVSNALLVTFGGGGEAGFVANPFTLSIAGGAGTFVLDFAGSPTGDLAWNIATADLQTAVEALAGLSAATVIVTGADGGPWTILANTAHVEITGLGSGGAEPTIAYEYIGGTDNRSTLVDGAAMDLGGKDVILCGGNQVSLIYDSDAAMWKLSDGQVIWGSQRVPLWHFRTWDDLSVNIPAIAAAGDFGLVTGTWHVDAPSLATIDAAGVNETAYVRVQFQLPDEYVPGADITLAIYCYMEVVADTSATLDVEACRTAAPVTELYLGAAIDVNRVDPHYYFFTLNGTDCVPGNVIDVRLAAAIVDAGVAPNIIFHINTFAARFNKKVY